MVHRPLRALSEVLQPLKNILTVFENLNLFFKIFRVSKIIFKYLAIFLFCEIFKMSENEPISEIVEYNGTRYSIIEIGYVVQNGENHQINEESENIEENFLDTDFEDEMAMDYTNELNRRKQLLAELLKNPTMPIKKPIKRLKPPQAKKNSAFSFMCSICNSYFATINKFRNHCQIRHTIPPPIKCKYCDEFFTLDDIGDHLIIHQHQAIDGKFSCEYCGKKYHRKNFLLLHISSKHHKTVEPCKHCSMLFRKNELSEHIVKFHGM